MPVYVPVYTKKTIGKNMRPYLNTWLRILHTGKNANYIIIDFYYSLESKVPSETETGIDIDRQIDK